MEESLASVNGDVNVGIGEAAISSKDCKVLKTYALGSCVAFLVYEKTTKTAGMVHVALPEASICPDRAKIKPYYFADTAVDSFLRLFEQKTGVKVSPSSYIIKLVGGANISDKNDTFNIGKRNVISIKKILWRYGLGPRAEDVGGEISRTVIFYAESGKVEIKSPTKGKWEI